MPVAKVINKGWPVKIWTNEIDDNALSQLENISQMPFIHKHVAAMPDVHWGMGATIGSVIPTKGAIIPAAVGVDLGCGIGNYAMWFAANGFSMTGLDLSKNAIDLANKRVIQKGVNCQFVVKDMTEIVQDFDNIFNFAYDWEVLHHIFPENRKRYVSNVHRMLRSNGKYFSLCFSEDEPAKFGGNGKYRKTPLGTTLYFSSEQELRNLFESFFIIEQLYTTEVRGKKGTHIAIKALMRKKDT